MTDSESREHTHEGEWCRVCFTHGAETMLAGIAEAESVRASLPAGVGGDREALAKHVRQHVSFRDLGTAQAGMELTPYCPEYPAPADATRFALSQPDYRHVIEAFAAIFAALTTP